MHWSLLSPLQCWKPPVNWDMVSSGRDFDKRMSLEMFGIFSLVATKTCSNGIYNYVLLFLLFPFGNPWRNLKIIGCPEVFTSAWLCMRSIKKVHVSGKKDQGLQSQTCQVYRIGRSTLFLQSQILLLKRYFEERCPWGKHCFCFCVSTFG